MFDPQLFEAPQPPFEFTSIGTPEGDVVETNAVLVERFLPPFRCGVMFVEPEHRFEPYGKSEGGLVADEEGRCIEEGRVPSDTSIEIADGQGKVRERGESGHGTMIHAARIMSTQKVYGVGQ